MSMKKHVTMKCRAVYAQLYNICKIRKYLDHQSVEQLIHAVVHSYSDYRNALLTGLPKYVIKKLQRVQNTTARVLYRVGKYEHNNSNTQMTPLAASRVPHQVKDVYIDFLCTAQSWPEYTTQMFVTIQSWPK